MTTPPSSPEPRRLLRSREGRMLGGVCQGIARSANLDPALVRVLTVALALFTGLALVVVYLLLWVALPQGDEAGNVTEPAPLSRLFGTDGSAPTLVRVLAVLAVAAGALVGLFLLLFGSGWFAAEFGEAGPLIFAGVLAVGGVIAAIAWKRRALLALAPALAIALPATFIGAAGVEFDGGYGERDYRPTSSAAIPPEGYKLAAGAMEIDLRQARLAPGTTTKLPLKLGMGAATVIVPKSVCVQAGAEFGGGYLDVLGRGEGGWDLSVAPAVTTTTAPRLALDADVGLGAVEIVDDPAQARLRDREGGRGSEQDGWDDDDGWWDDDDESWGRSWDNRPLGNQACRS